MSSLSLSLSLSLCARREVVARGAQKDGHRPQNAFTRERGPNVRGRLQLSQHTWDDFFCEARLQFCSESVDRRRE